MRTMFCHIRIYFVAAVVMAMLLICSGCAPDAVSLDDSSVNAYFRNVPTASDECTFVYEDMNGINFLKSVHDSASVISRSSWYNDGSYCKLTGCYDGNWFYGYGTEDRLLAAYGTDKDQVYSLMQGYGVEG